jgi:hypothetical protein
MSPPHLAASKYDTPPRRAAFSTLCHGDLLNFEFLPRERVDKAVRTPDQCSFEYVSLGGLDPFSSVTFLLSYERARDLSTFLKSA